MATTTTNYNLIKPAAEDFYNVQDQNDNMEIIDQALKAHDMTFGTKVDGVSGKGLSTNDFSNAYKQKVDQNTVNISALQTGKVDLVDGKVPSSQMPVNVVPVVITAGSGTAFTVTVDGVTDLKKGMLLIIIPHIVSASTTPTLNVNGLGAKTVSRRTSATTTAGNAGYITNWLTAGIPVLIEYDGTYWVAIGQAKPNAADLTGTTPVSAGGTGKTNWTAYQLIYSSGTATLAQLAFPATAGSFLRQDSAGAPYFSTPAQVLTGIGAVASSEKGVPGGIASLDAAGKLTESQSPDMATEIAVTLSSGGWIGTGPWTQAVNVSGVTANTKGVFGLAASTTAAQYEAATAAGIRVSNVTTNTITVTAANDKPTINLPCTILIIK